MFQINPWEKRQLCECPSPSTESGVPCSALGYGVEGLGFFFLAKFEVTNFVLCFCCCARMPSFNEVAACLMVHCNPLAEG